MKPDWLHPNDIVTKEFMVYVNDRYRDVVGQHMADLEVVPEAEGDQEVEPVAVTLHDRDEGHEVATALLLRAIDEAGLAPGPYWEFIGAQLEEGITSSDYAYTVTYRRLQVFGATDMWPSECPNCGKPCRAFIDLRDEDHDAVLMECDPETHPPGCGYRWIEEEGD